MALLAGVVIGVVGTVVAEVVLLYVLRERVKGYVADKLLQNMVSDMAMVGDME